MPNHLRPNRADYTIDNFVPPQDLSAYLVVAQPIPSSEQSFTVISLGLSVNCPPDDPGGTAVFYLYAAMIEDLEASATGSPIGSGIEVTIGITPDDDTVIHIPLNLTWIDSSTNQYGAYMIVGDLEDAENVEFNDPAVSLITIVGA